MTRKGKKIHEKLIAKNAKSNPKAFWRYAQSKLKTRAAIPDLIIPGTESDPKYVSSDREKAEIFVNYFSSVFTTEPDDETMPPFEERDYSEVIDNINITYETVLKKLKKLKINKSPGPDTIHPRVIHEIAESVSTPLAIIFSTSIRNKTLPEEWKQANISSIFKKGKKTHPQNYRPVSLTSIICKTMESIIRDHVIDHMKQNNLFSPKQFGFINGRSTVLQLLHVLKIWTEIIDQGGTLDAIYCDFMKAFDKVPHKRLIYKLDKYGIKGNILGWIHSFLNGRTQKVNINGSFSTAAPVSSGIPQGSVLGPILFVIYINDLPDVIDKNSFAYLFADDTKIFREIKSQADIDILQKDIDKLVEWSNLWLLKFHPDKCVHIGIGINRKQDNSYRYKMEDKNLKISSCEKDIGVFIDSKLKFEEHINHAVNKANRVLGIARKTFDYMDIKTFNHIFKALVRPHLEYAAPIWFPHHNRLKEMIENVQRRATKMVPGLSHLSYPDRLKKLKLPTLSYRRVRGDMIQTYKLLDKINGYDQSLPPLLTMNNTGLWAMTAKNFF